MTGRQKKIWMRSRRDRATLPKKIPNKKNRIGRFDEHLRFAAACAIFRPDVPLNHLLAGRPAGRAGGARPVPYAIQKEKVPWFENGVVWAVEL